MKTPCPPHEVAIHTPPSPPEDPFATPEEPRSEEVKTGGRDGGAGGGIKDEERERDVHEGTLGNDEEHAGDSEEDARERAEG